MLKAIAGVLALCTVAAAQATRPAADAARPTVDNARPATRPTKQLYFDVNFHTPTWRARLPPGFLPAIAEGGGRFVSAAGKEDSYFVGGYRGPLEHIIPAKLRVAVASLPAGTLYVYDKESPSWSSDIRAAAPDVADANRKRYREVAEAVREGNPAVRVALYGMLPFGDFWTTTRQYNARKVFEKWQSGAALNGDDKWSISKAYSWNGSAYVLDDTIAGPEGRAAFRQWQAANDHDATAPRADGSPDPAAGLIGAVDALTPSLYDFYEGDDTEGYVHEMIAEARRLANGRPVYPFIWPVYHNSNAKVGGQTIPLDEWRAHVRRVLRQADGCVLWGADPVRHREHIRVVLEEAEFASREAGGN